MESTVVIKVKYGETLRRFNARTVDEELTLNMTALREKILCLFNFPIDSVLTLTYIDEDGDVVTLADDEDLQDVMRQALNPLRITVTLKTEKSGISHTGNSTPIRLPRVEPPLKISGILKCVPEAIREILSRLSTELGADTTSFPPGYGELLDSLSKIGLVHPKEVSADSTPDAPVTKDKNGAKADLNTPAAKLESKEADQGDSTVIDLVAPSAVLCSGKLSVGSLSTSPALGSFGAVGDHKKEKVKNLGATNCPSDYKMKEIKNSNESHLGLNSVGVGSLKSNNHLNLNNWNPMAPELDSIKVAAGSGNFSRCGFGTPVAESESKKSDQGNLTGFSEGFRMPAADFAVPHGDKISVVGSSSANSAHGPFGGLGDRKKDKVKKFGECNARGNYCHWNRVATNSPSGDKIKEISKSTVSNLGLKSVGDNKYLNLNTWDAPKLGGIEVSGDKTKEINKSNESSMGLKAVGVNDYVNPNTWDHVSPEPDGIKVHAGCENYSGLQFGLNTQKECPYTGVTMENYPSPVPGAPRMVQFKRIHHHSNGIGSVFHRGVRCDGCGVHPITGVRFKSKVREKYDLCSICFADIGNAVDYIRMDRPMNYQHRVSVKGFYDPPYRGHPPTEFFEAVNGSASQSNKLDSRFIQDVNIMDGTIITPSIPFTKIWRLRNNGAAVWPRGTQLMWIGGDRFSKALSADLQIPYNGCPVDTEVDVAVDFIAPQHPGRYISYWRMALPSGQMFGQRVWVLIQVDGYFKDLFAKSTRGLNLNLPPVSSGIMGSHCDNLSVEPMIEDRLPKPENSNRATKLERPMVDLNFPTNDTSLVGGAISDFTPLDVTSPVTYPTIDISKVEPVEISPLQTSDICGNGEVEQTRLKELEDMGFKHVDFNKEILRLNEYNLEQSVHDRCGVVEWEPMP